MLWCIMISRTVLFWAGFVLVPACILGAHISPQNEPDVQAYLQQFGYLQKTNPETGNLVSHDHLVDAVKNFQVFANLPVTGKQQILQDEASSGSKVARAIKNFQKFAGLPETGLLDAETKRMMNAPRCGVPDIVEGEIAAPSGQTHRRKRFVLQGSKWRVKDLTWSVSQPTSQLSVNDIESQLARAWKVWSDHSDLSFTKSNGGNVHIDVRFAKFEHGDGDAFDGPGKTLAHAFFPQYGGDAHFDDSESWSTGRWGTNLFQVAAHEFGHSLGLSHSNVKSSLMAPFYRGYDDNLSLDQDDIAAIQDIYGPPSYGKNQLVVPARPVPQSPVTSPRRPTFRPRPSFGGVNKPSICQSPSIDAITITADGTTYAFKDDVYYQLNDYGIETGFPRKISDDWDGLPNNLDAALTWSDGKTFFFKGGKYWRFVNKKALPGYPKAIRKGFTGIPDDMDAAFVWSGNGKTYFIKGSQYWRYDSAAEVPVSADYPKSLSTWEGLPDHIDAAFQWKNGKTFFFSGSEYYRLNDNKFAVETDYPRPNDIWWFGCGADSKKDFASASNPNNLQERPPLKDARRPSPKFDDLFAVLNDAVAPPKETFVTVFTEGRLPNVATQINRDGNSGSRNKIAIHLFAVGIILVVLQRCGNL